VVYLTEIDLQVPLRDIGLLLLWTVSGVNEDCVVRGFFCTVGVLLVHCKAPHVGRLAGGVVADDNAAVSIFLVFDYLANAKADVLRARYSRLRGVAVAALGVKIFIDFRRWALIELVCLVLHLHIITF